MRSGWTAGPPSAGPALQDLQEPSHRRVELARRFQIRHVAGLWKFDQRRAGDALLHVLGIAWCGVMVSSSPTMIAAATVTRRSPSDESGRSFIASSPAAIVSTGCASISALNAGDQHRAARPASWPRGCSGTHSRLAMCGGTAAADERDAPIARRASDLACQSTCAVGKDQPRHPLRCPAAGIPKIT